MIRIAPASSPDHVEAARRLFKDYAASLDLDLCFQNFDTELAGLPGDYAPPRGALLLAFEESGDVIGCVALRPLEWPQIAELKRLYVAPAGRGRGLGRELTLKALQVAREAGYARIRLDTLPVMTSAQRLYEDLGFRDIEPYRFNPIESARYMELVL